LFFNDELLAGTIKLKRVLRCHAYVGRPTLHVVIFMNKIAHHLVKNLENLLSGRYLTLIHIFGDREFFKDDAGGDGCDFSSKLQVSTVIQKG